MGIGDSVSGINYFSCHQSPVPSPQSLVLREALWAKSEWRADNMELIKRILRVIRANLNSLIGSAEDPEKILEQAVMEMQENLVQLRQGVAQAIATQKRTERQAAAAQLNIRRMVSPCPTGTATR